MALINRQKVVGALPGVLQPDTEYLVRVGRGYDSYVTNHSGTIVAYPQNHPIGLPVPTLVASGLWVTPGIISNITTGGSNTAGDLRLTPYSPTRTFTINQLGIITTGTTSGGTNAARLVVYSSDVNGAPDVPLTSVEVTGLNVANTFIGTLATPFTFQASVLYWVGIHGDFTNTHRQMTNAVMPNLGLRTSTSTTGNVCVNRNTPYANGLPNPFNFTINDLNSFYVSEVRMRIA